MDTKKSSYSCRYITFVIFSIFKGTAEERGLIAWADQMKLSKNDDDLDAGHQSSTYDFPIGMKLVKR